LIYKDKIQPVYFGEDSELYGCYHFPYDSTDTPATLICQSTGYEYERCHRAMRQLAVQLSRKGMVALRFDYFGTGNSAGDSEDVSLQRMREDIQQAIISCRKRTGANKLALVGLRLGARMAAQVAGSSTEIDSLVLYAPVFNSKELVNEWRHQQRVFNSKHSHSKVQSSQEEVLGFPVTTTFQQELIEDRTIEANNTSVKRVLILVDESELEAAELMSCVDTFQSNGADVTVESVESIAIWKREPMEAIVPIRIIRRIARWIIGA